MNSVETKVITASPVTKMLGFGASSAIVDENIARLRQKMFVHA